jgi:hypothetical protein
MSTDREEVNKPRTLKQINAPRQKSRSNTRSVENDRTDDVFVKLTVVIKSGPGFKCIICKIWPHEACANGTHA